MTDPLRVRSLTAGEIFDEAVQAELEARPLLDVALGMTVEDGSQAVVLAHELLQDQPDYRQALRTWFQAVSPGGRMIVTVPHAFLHDRAFRLEERRRSDQKRLYTPATLLQEVEEALTPNTYRVRRLIDADSGYDYQSPRETPPKGAHHIILVLEKIPDTQMLLAAEGARPRQSASPNFGPARTRVESAVLAPSTRILALKLDHLGDFIMGLPALEQLRAIFPTSHITLVVGSWNFDLARRANVADEILTFDVFPRNSSEESVDVPGKTSMFEKLITKAYDIAIDLRVDPDTRHLLQSVRSGLRVGMGTRNQFPFLDIFLPVDFSRGEREQARRDDIDHHSFYANGDLARSEHRIHCNGRAPRDNALVWGPYWSLRAGNYIFEPFLEIEGSGSLILDVGLNTIRECGLVIPCAEPARLSFVVGRDDTQFEFRIWPMDGSDLPPFSFYGGRLVREGASGVLHQSEYGRLLIELLRIRISDAGVFSESMR